MSDFTLPEFLFAGFSKGFWKAQFLTKYFAITRLKELLPAVPSYSPMPVQNLGTSCNPKKKQSRSLDDHPIYKTAVKSFLRLPQHYISI